MLTCEHCRTRLLPYLYELVDENERLAIEVHVDGCQACQAELAKAKAQQKLLARAAKAEFAKVSFQPPAEESSVPSWRVRFSFAKLALAASVLLTIGFGLPAAWWTVSYGLARAQLAAVQQREQAAHQQLLALSQQLDAAQPPPSAPQPAAADKQLDVLVTGPANLQPGAPNNFQVQTRSPRGQPVEADLSIMLVDDQNKTLYERRNVRSKGAFNLELPLDLNVDGRRNVKLELVASREGAADSTVSADIPLAGPAFLTHLTTDKPMYRPGETVYFRSLTLERSSLKPAETPFHLLYTITDARGAEIFKQSSLAEVRAATMNPISGPDGMPVHGIGAGTFQLGPDLPGGEYTLTVREENSQFTPGQRKFIVNKYENPRLNKKLDFSRKSYGPGQDVEALCSVTRAEGGAPVAGREVTVSVTIDGKSFDRSGQEGKNPWKITTDNAGRFSVQFKLPAVIERGIGVVSVQCDDGGSVETLVRPIPIALKKLLIDFYPEGGDLVAGVPNRVYFQARTTLDKPAELKGRIVDAADGNLIAAAATLHDDQEPGINQGMGRFTFLPQPGHRYELRIDEPAAMEGKYELPTAKAEGVVLALAKEVIGPKDSVPVIVRSVGKDRKLLVGAYVRSQLLDHENVTVRSGEDKRIDLHLSGTAGGVCRLTVFEERTDKNGKPQFVPVAERLFYRRPTAELHVSLKPNLKHYAPGEKVKMTVEATREDNQPAPAVVLLSVVDKSVVTLADEKTARSMPTHFLLTSEVRKPEDLEYADVLLGSHAKAPQALDLLLGTQGWRRFAEQDPAKFRKEFAGEAERLLVSSGLGAPLQIDVGQAGRERAAKEQIAKMDADRRDQLQALSHAQQQLTAIEGQRKTLDQHLNELEKLAARPYILLGLALVALLAVVSLVNAFVQSGLPRLRAYGPLAGSLATLGLLLAVLIQVGILPGSEKEFKVVGLALASPAPRNGQPLAKRQPAFAAVVEGAAQPFQGQNEPAAPAGGPGGGLVQPHAPAARQFRFAGRAGAPAHFDNRDGAPDDHGRNGAYPWAPAIPDVPAQAAPEADMAKVKDRIDAPPMIADKLDLGRKALDERDNENKLANPAGHVEQRKAREDLAGFLQDEPLDARRRAGEKKKPLMQKVSPPTPIIIREYAHQHPLVSADQPRTDFAETIYWHPVLVLPGGKTEISFDLPDSITTFQATAYAHTLDGRLGAETTTIESRLPFTLEPKLPIEVSSDDTIDIPVSVANNTEDAREVQMRLAVANGVKFVTEPGAMALTLSPEARGRQIFHVRPSIVDGTAQLTFDGASAPYRDQVSRSFRVVPNGFPIVGAHSDLLEKSAKYDLVLPDSWIPGTLSCRLQAFPSPLAQLQSGLEGLLREPYGCFEQTSNTNYPNVLILQYLKESGQTNLQVQQHALALLASGYHKLTAFECLDQNKNSRQGYEWFGGTAPAHEALTAYGLMEFRDMAAFQPVDADMLERTREYLLSRRDGKGGFQRNPRALDSFGHAPDGVTNAYIVWAITESSKTDDVSRELNALAADAKTSKDPYFLALVAISLLNRDRAEEALPLLKTVTALQHADGYLDAAQTSITGSGGRDLQIETTALAVLGWLKANRPAEFAMPLQNAITWIGKQRGGYGAFGSTQSTILALKALIAYTRANKATAEPGEIHLSVAGKLLWRLVFGAGVSQALVIDVPNPEKNLKPGKNAVQLEITGKTVLPYTLSWSYHTLRPPSAADCAVHLAATLDRAEAREGEAVHLSVRLENTQDKGQGMAVAIIGLPGGLTLPEDMKQLKDHARLRNNGTESGLVSAWEIRGRELILYWRDLAPKQKIEVPLDLICRVPGQFSGPASRAYLYYNADHKHWIEPLKIKVDSRE